MWIVCLIFLSSRYVNIFFIFYFLDCCVHLSSQVYTNIKIFIQNYCEIQNHLFIIVLTVLMDTSSGWSFFAHFWGAKLKYFYNEDCNKRLLKTVTCCGSFLWLLTRLPVTNEFKLNNDIAMILIYIYCFGIYKIHVYVHWTFQQFNSKHAKIFTVKATSPHPPFLKTLFRITLLSLAF